MLGWRNVDGWLTNAFICVSLPADQILGAFVEGSRRTIEDMPGWRNGRRAGLKNL